MTIVDPTTEDPVAPPDTVRTGLLAGAGGSAVVLAIGIVVTTSGPPSRHHLVIAVAVGALVALGVGLFTRRPVAVGLAVAAFGLADVLNHRVVGASVPGSVVVVAPVLVLVAELAAWAIDLSPAVDDGRGVHADRARWVALAAAVAALVALVVAGAGRVRIGQGRVLDALSVAAAVGLVSLVVALARRDGRGGARPGH